MDKKGREYALLIQRAYPNSRITEYAKRTICFRRDGPGIISRAFALVPRNCGKHVMQIIACSNPRCRQKFFFSKN